MGRSLVSKEELLDLLDNNDQFWRRYQVDYPEDCAGPFYIKHFDIAKDDPGRLAWVEREGILRDPGYGTFRKLIEMKPEGTYEKEEDDHVLWMSDTKAEILEHSPILEKLYWNDGIHGKRVLINGLGLGLIARAAASYPSVSRVDVVEVNADIIKLVGKYLPDKVVIHHADAYGITWPPYARWDVAWHDIWPTIDDENLPGMDKLISKYRSRVGWQGCWQRQGCLKMRKFFRMAKAGTLPVEDALDYLGGRFQFD